MIPLFELKSQAIQKALTGDWYTAINLNQNILKEDPEDIETLNRLAFAFRITGNIKQAKAMYQKVLELDNQNPIALKNIKRLTSSSSKKDNLENYQAHQLTPHMSGMFLEESGKTKVIELVNIAESKTLSHLITGESINLTIKRLKIFVLDRNNQYVGILPEDIGKRLIKFIKGGNMYQACIKSIEKNKVIIFIKEAKRSTRFKNQPSFILSEKTKIEFPKHEDYDSLDKESSDEEEP